MNRLHNFLGGEVGHALPIVLAMLVLGSLVVAPSLDYTTTNLKAGQMAESRAKAIYAAEAGVADAIWRIRNTSMSPMPYSFQISDVNRMSVSVVIDAVTEIAGQEIGPTGVHGGWLKIDKLVTYNAGVYTVNLTMTNNGDGNMRIEEVLIDLPTSLEYVAGSTSGQVTSSEPVVIGDPNVGITLFWSIPDYYIIGQHDTATHVFQLSGPAGVQGVEGHSVVKATREDVGTVWDSDSRPYSISSQVRDASSAVLATLNVGVWKGTSRVEISCWQISP